MRRFVHLPEEVVEEILLRLPTKSLIRFKCVCKSWYTLINDPSFATHHCQFNENRVLSSTMLYLTWTRHVDDDTAKFEQVHSLVTLSHGYDGDKDVNDDQVPCTVKNFDFLFVPGVEEKHLWNGQHCNGLLLFNGLPFVKIKNSIIYNPANREFKVLPGRSPVHIGGGEVLAYDSKENVHKFVRITVSRSANMAHVVEIYTIGSETRREIRIDPDIPRIFLLQCKGLHCQGICYWRGVSGEGYIVLSFDLSSEKLRAICLPLSHQKLYGHAKKLAVWNKSVVLLVSQVQDRTGPLSFEIWALDSCSGDDKGPCSWTKCMTVGPVPGIGLPIAFWKSNEFLSRSDDGRIVSYNFSTKKIRYLPIDLVEAKFCFADFYVESLVSFKSRN